MDLLASGLDVATVAMWLGHEKLESVNAYVHSDLTMKERALDRRSPFKGPSRQVPAERRAPRLPRGPLIMPSSPGRAPPAIRSLVTSSGRARHYKQRGTKGVMPTSALRLVPELDGLAEAAFRDQAGVRLVQADPPGCPAGHRAGQPLPGLRGDCPGHLQQAGQVIDRPAQPAPQPPRGSTPQPGGGQGRRRRLGPAQRAAGVG
jgi:hypothetical protein